MSVFVSFLVATALVAEQPAAPAEPALIFEAAHDKIELGDPLFTKATIVNRGATELRFALPVMVGIHVRSVGGEWSDTGLHTHALNVGGPDTVVRPGEKLAFYKVLFGGPDI